MFKNKITYYIIFLIISLTLSSCNGYQKLLKSTDNELKYQKAIEYYEKEDYYKAQELLRDLRIAYKGIDVEKSEKVSFCYAQCAYGLGEYSVASYLFKDFIRQHPISKYSEEALFLSSYCYFLLSPEVSLEQTFTEVAIVELQLFIERYPNSGRRQEAESLIDILQMKLETKAYNNAMLYFTIGDYRAATIALKNVLLDFPDTKYKEDILFTILKSSFLLAENSIYSKQQERYKSTVDSYHKFIDNFPDSKKAKEAEKYYTNSLKFIEKSHGL